MKPYCILASVAAGCVAAGPLAAQRQSDSLARIAVVPMVSMGGPAEDRVRLDQLRGNATTEGWLMRSTQLLAAPLRTRPARVGGPRGCDLRWALLAPESRLSWNSRLPFERNDGGVWSGRGLTLHFASGARAECGRLRAQFAPELWHARNTPFPILGPMIVGLSGFASPFYSGREASADLPLRFGSEPLTVMQFGQSGVELDAGRVTIGLGSQSQWWGPGIRNALVMSNHAAGIPAAYVRTTRPVRGRVGAAEARWIVGALTESPYFDFDASNDMRSLSGLVVTLSPAVDSNLTLGVARVVYAGVAGIASLPARFLDAVARWGPGSNVREATFGRAAEQLSSVFARWVFPRSGVETYAEWSRVILPASLKSLLLAPQYSQGYTLGTQWISSVDTQSVAWRTQLELTMVEQPRRSRAQEPPSFYVSPVVAHGYTHRGRVIGAMVGPGGSNQFLAIDRMRSSWSVGGMLGRIRWNNEQYYRRPSGNLSLAHDVSLYAGLRGRRSVKDFDFTLEWIAEKRLNYLFQSTVFGYGEDYTFDVRNTSLRLTLTPR